MLSLNLCSINNIMKLLFLCCQFYSFPTILNVCNWPNGKSTQARTRKHFNVRRGISGNYFNSFQQFIDGKRFGGKFRGQIDAPRVYCLYIPLFEEHVDMRKCSNSPEKTHEGKRQILWFSWHISQIKSIVFSDHEVSPTNNALNTK